MACENIASLSEQNDMSHAASSQGTIPEPCQLCGYPAWTEEPLDPTKVEIVVESYDELHASSKSGCLGCRVLSEGWAYGTPVAEKRKDEWITLNRGGSPPLYFHLFKEPGVMDIDIFTLPLSPRFKHIRFGSLIPPRTNLDENLCRVQQWLQKCDEEHKLCRASPDHLPIRLLDIDTKSPDTIRLVHYRDLSTDLLHKPSYACLSHCWGTSRSKHITKHENFETNCEGIPISELPRTFREAVLIARALHLQYIWIDSMCIVQDDEEDWTSHVKLMAKIYSNAYITLAAGASSDDSGGFFREAAPEFSHPHSFQILDGHGVHEIFMRRHLSHPDEHWPLGRRLPLMERGWAFQERLLSRRYLCFAESELLWECREDVACSCSTNDAGFNHRDRPGTNPAFPKCHPNKFSIAHMSELPRKELLSLWRNIVSQYTERLLTFPKDKLPALDGFRQVFDVAFASQGGPCSYLWGSWREALKGDLLWTSYGYDDVGRPRNAPSWSWASASDGGIEWRGLLYDSKWTVKGILHIDPQVDLRQNVGHDNHALLLHGNLASITLQTRGDSNDVQKTCPGFRACLVCKYTAGSVGLDLMVESEIPSIPSAFPGAPRPRQTREQISQIPWASGVVAKQVDNHGDFFADYKFWKDEIDLWHILDDVFFLDLGRESTYDFPWATGLVLRYGKQAIDGRPTYERIGWLRFSTGKQADEWEPVGTDQDVLIV